MDNPQWLLPVEVLRGGLVFFLIKAERMDFRLLGSDRRGGTRPPTHLNFKKPFLTNGVLIDTRIEFLT